MPHWWCGRAAQPEPYSPQPNPTRLAVGKNDNLSYLAEYRSRLRQSRRNRLMAQGAMSTSVSSGGGIRRGTCWPARAVALGKGEHFLSFSPRLDFLFSS